MVNHTVGRILDLFDVPHENIARWEGMKPAKAARKKGKT
jgi:3-polyprenyl-4-hydroxybenzoate decarboxylase